MKNNFKILLGIVFAFNSLSVEAQVDEPSYNPTDLRGLLNGGMPQIGFGMEIKQESLALIKRISELNKRVALLEMTKHEFIDTDYKKERTTFSDGITVTVDWNNNTVRIFPELTL